MAKNEFGTPFSATATGATAAYATVTGVNGTSLYVTDIVASSDKTGAVVTVSDGSTVKWQATINQSGPAAPFIESFQTPLSISRGATLQVSVTSTAAASVNVAGFKST